MRTQEKFFLKDSQNKEKIFSLIVLDKLMMKKNSSLQIYFSSWWLSCQKTAILGAEAVKKDI